MINSQTVFGRDHERLEMTRILHAARVEAGNGKDLDMEILLNQVGCIFKAEEEAASNAVFQKTAASNSCQLLNALTLRVIRQSATFSTYFKTLFRDSMPSRLLKILHAQIRPNFLYDHPHRRWSEILH